jgi:hypothetical protein
VEKIDNIDKSIEISKKNKDIIQKNASNLFRNTTLEYFGVKSARIKEMINVELPVVEVGESAMDSVLLHEDGSLTHFEFTTEYKEDDLPRFCVYDARLHKRERKKIQTIIIYSSNVKTIDENLEIGVLSYRPVNVMMSGFNGNDIYKDLEEKLKSGGKLTEADMLNLVFMPMMKWDESGLSRKDVTVKAIEMAKTLAVDVKRTACIASAVVFSHKYLNENELKQMLGVIRMTDLGVILMEEGFGKGIEKGIQEGLEKGLEEGLEKGRLEKAIEAAKNLLGFGDSIEKVSKVMDLPIEKVKEINDSLK